MLPEKTNPDWFIRKLRRAMDSEARSRRGPLPFSRPRRNTAPFMEKFSGHAKNDEEMEPLGPDTESQEADDELPEDASNESAENELAKEDDEDTTAPYECHGCGKKMKDSFSEVNTYLRDYHYCQDCTENGNKDEREQERHEALREELKRWGEDPRRRFESPRK